MATEWPQSLQPRLRGRYGIIAVLPDDRRARLTSSLGTLIDSLRFFTTVASGASNRLTLVPASEPIAFGDLDDAAYVAEAMLSLPKAAHDAADEVLGLARDLRFVRLVAVAGGR